MAQLKSEDLRDLSSEELVEKLGDLNMQFTKKKFAHAVSPLENPLELRWMRRDIARIKTELNSRKLTEKENNKQG